jgi:hypothetical protein
VLMYANVVMAGLRADAEVALQPSTAAGYWFRSMLIDFAPKMAMAAALAGLFGDELEEWFARVPSYDLEKYLILPLGWSTNDLGEKKAMYMRIPHDDANRILAGAIWTLTMNGRPHAISRTLGLVAGEFPGFAPPISLTKSWYDYATNRNPFDTFRGRNVVPQTQWEAGGWDRAKEMFRWTLGEFGVISQLPGIANFTSGSPDESRSAKGEELLRAIPGVSALIKITDAGLNEQRWWEMDWERRERARLRMDLSPAVRRATSERSRLNSYGVERLSDTERARRAQLNAWYRAYLSLTAAMENARDTQDRGGYERARLQLESLTEPLSERPRPAGQDR